MTDYLLPVKDQPEGIKVNLVDLYYSAVAVPQLNGVESNLKSIKGIVEKGGSAINELVSKVLFRIASQARSKEVRRSEEVEKITGNEVKEESIDQKIEKLKQEIEKLQQMQATIIEFIAEIQYPEALLTSGVDATTAAVEVKRY